MNLVKLLKRKNNKILFTTPSHNGKLCIFHKFYQWYKSDISEVEAYNPQESLLCAEKTASKIYKTKYTKFLTNGSTSGVIAAVMASKCKKILVWDKAHPCHKNACKLSGADIIEYELPFDDELGVYKSVSFNDVKNLVEKFLPDGIIITTPTYEGFAADVIKISEYCKEHNVKFIADEAHGALYPFSDELPESAVCWADYTIQSLHKTAGGINPTALLHSNDNDPSGALSKITTTSPSYPMLATIEANIKFLNSQRGRKCISQLIDNIKNLGLPKYNDDITKIILKSKKYSGHEISDILFEKYNIEDERTNDRTTMLLCGIGTNAKMLKKLSNSIKNII